MTEHETMLSALKAGDTEGYIKLVRTVPFEQRENTLWPAIGKKHGINVNLVDELVSWPRDKPREAMTYLVPAIAHAPSLSLSDARALLQYAPSAGLSFLHRLAASLRPHFARDISLALQLGGELQHGGRSEEEHRAWAQALCAASATRALSFAMSLTTSVVGPAHVYSTVLQYLPVGQADVLAEIVCYEETLVEQAIDAIAAIGENGWFGLSALARVSKKATERLVAGVRQGDRGAVLAGCSLLQLGWETDPSVSRQDLVELAGVVTQTALTNPSYCAPVGRALASLIHNDKTRNVGQRCLEQMGGCQTMNAVEGMEEAFDALCEFPDAFGSVLTAWLISPAMSFNSLRSLLSKCGSGRAPVVLAAGVFAAATPERKLAASRRLLSLCINGNVLCQFIGLLAESEALQPHGLQLAEGLLNQAFVEYPNATVEFLKMHTGPTARSSPHSRLYRGVLANALRWKRVLERLPRLKELRPTDLQLRALHMMQWRRNAEIMRIARERSVFASLATQVNLAQGRKFASHFGRGTPQVSETVETKHSMELPSSETADPVGGALTRVGTLSAAQ